MAAQPGKPLRERGRGIFRTKYTCCGKTMHSNRAQKAHHLAEHSGRWSSDQARKIARKIGKPADRARRHARSWREAAGLIDPRGNRTAKGRARPEARTRTRLRDLRQMHRHDRGSDRTDQRAGRFERRAGRADARADRREHLAARLKQSGRTRSTRWAESRSAAHRERATGHRARVADVRMAHHQRWPERTRT